jgi:enamine deaminase RidA (YjgF/YER057c/UK114 family)
MSGAVIQGKRAREWFHTLLPDPENPIQSVLEQLHSVVFGEGWPQVLEVRIFGSSDTFEVLRSGLEDFSGSADWPISLLDGSPAPGGGVAGVQLHLVEGAPVQTIRLEDEVVGRAFEDEGARYCVLGGVGPYDPVAHPAEQTTATLLRLEEALQSQGMELKNLARTWFFLDHILGWYGQFNAARTEIFRKRGIFQGYVPASTGIGGRNHRGSALMASALAMLPRAEGLGVAEIPSPLQCPAEDYGSSFSRAAEMTGPGFRRVLVSGTASIDPEGRTAHPGQVQAQMIRTIEVVRAILESRGMEYGDTIRGNAYFNNAGNAEALAPLLRDYGVPLERLLVSRNTVCREDLLFEMEVDTVRMEDGA